MPADAAELCSLGHEAIEAAPCTLRESHLGDKLYEFGDGAGRGVRVTGARRDPQRRPLSPDLLHLHPAQHLTLSPSATFPRLTSGQLHMFGRKELAGLTRLHTEIKHLMAYGLS
jgi:hypothetical protein